MKNFSSFRFTQALPRVFFICFTFFFVIPLVSFGAETTFTPLANLPGMTPTTVGGGLGNYLNQLYKFLIVLGAIFGVIKIAIAGAKYSLSDIVTDKGKAIQDIQGVLLGLAILLIPFIVLNTIYSNLTSLDILKNASSIGSGAGGTTGGTGGTGGGGGGTGTGDPCAMDPDPATCRGLKEVIDTCTYDKVTTVESYPDTIDKTVTSFDSTICKAFCNSQEGSTFTDKVDHSECRYKN